MCQIFIHSAVHEHLGCFHVLPLVDSAAMNIGGACVFFVCVCVLGPHLKHMEVPSLGVESEV